MATIGQVSAGKPKIGGAVYRADAGSALPESASAQLDAAFVELGYVSEDGVTNSNSPATDEVKAWGGDVVMNLQTGKPDTFKFKLIEALNVNVLKAVYGDGNVSGTASTGITVTANASVQGSKSWVFDMLMNGSAKRIVVPLAEVTNIGDIVYVDGAPVGYEITLSAHPDEDGNTHYEYIGGVSA